MGKTLAFLVALLCAAPASAWTMQGDRRLVTANQERVWIYEWDGTATDSTPLDVTDCSTVSAAFDPSTGDTSTDATVTFAEVPSATSERAEGRPLSFSPSSETAYYQLNTTSGKYLLVDARSATAGGDTARVTVRCYGPESEQGATALVNLAADTDGNALADSVTVGDYDGDGTLETADIASAVAALTDTGPKYVYVLPGDYASPGTVLAGDRSLIQLDSNTHFECAGPDITTIRGDSWIHGDNGSMVARAIIGNSTDDDEENITVTNCGFDGNYPASLAFDFGDTNTTSENIDLEDGQGFDINVTHDDTAYESGDGPFRVVQGTAALPTGISAATDYWIIRVDADTIRLAATRADALAGTPPVNITAQGTGENHLIGPSPDTEGIVVDSNMGMLFRGVTNLRIVNNHVSHTLHTCIYASSAPGVLIDGNEMEYCGNYGSIDAVDSYAAVYLFGSNGKGALEKGVVSNNRALRVATAYNTRGDTPSANDLTQQILWSGNYADRADAACYAFRSAKNQQVFGGHCINSSNFFIFEGSTTSYMDQDSAGGANAAQGIVVQNVQAFNMNGPSSAIQVGPYSDNVSFQNVVVDRTSVACMSVTQPLRGLVIDGLTLQNCGRQGISVTGVATNAQEGITLRNTVIEDMDQSAGPADGTRYPGLLMNAAADYLTLENVTISGGTDRQIRLLAGGAKMRWSNVTLDCKPPRMRGPFTETGTAQADDYVCDAGTIFDILHVTNSSATSDCDFASGTGAVHAWCMCDGDGTYTPVVQGTEIPDRDGLLYAGAIDDSEFTNITGLDCIDEYTFGGTAAVTDSKFTGINAYADTAFYNGSAHNPPIGALEIAAGSSNVLIDMRTFQCVNTDGTALACVATAEDDLAIGSLFMDDTCDAPCTNGSTCIDSDAATGSLQQCESAAWNVLD